ncbi:MAG: hypothetical protein DRO11_03315, partial [Methanobacteriota archaeon]
GGWYTTPISGDEDFDCVNLGDFDGDGGLDVVAGNLQDDIYWFRRPEIWFEDVAGNRIKTVFDNTEIYVRGVNLEPNDEVRIYVVEDRDDWADGMSLVDVTGGYETVTTDSEGVLPRTLVWASSTAGNYDLVIDTNLNGEYNPNSQVEPLEAFLGAGLRVLETPVYAANNLGVTQKYFYPGEAIYVFGDDYTPNILVDLYVVTNDDEWFDGTPLVDINGDVETVQITGTGELPLTMVLGPMLTVGEWDIVVDVDRDGLYDEGVDVVNSLDTAGVIVRSPGVRSEYNWSPRDIFFVGETVKVYGWNFKPGDVVDLYVVQNNDSWVNGQTLTDVSGGAETATASSGGSFRKTVWVEALIGEYDLVVDTDQDGVYTEGVDFVDSLTEYGFVTLSRIVLPADENGDAKTNFPPSAEIYVIGSGFTPGSSVDIYVIETTDSMPDGTPLTDYRGAPTTVDVNNVGQIETTLLWATPEEGDYDIVADVDQDGVFDTGRDWWYGGFTVGEEEREVVEEPGVEPTETFEAAPEDVRLPAEEKPPMVLDLPIVGYYHGVPVYQDNTRIGLDGRPSLFILTAQGERVYIPYEEVFGAEEEEELKRGGPPLVFWVCLVLFMVLIVLVVYYISKK